MLCPETLPEARDGDAYVMRLILHDWDDKDCTAILANVRRAMGSANASLLIVEVRSAAPIEHLQTSGC